MDIDLPVEVGPTTEETVDALLEYLVGPLVPLKHFDIASETPSEMQQKSVAKQVYAAAVLYNYFHLNHHKGSQFLKFDQFCKLAIMFKPSILHHMKYMRQSNRPNLDDPENQLSLTEKAIMDACTMSKTLLNALDNISNVIEEWSITKVAVLLIDLKMENCFLKFGNGVWSVIEKDLYPESKKCKKTMINHDEEREGGFQKLAFLAVEEATGNVNGELKVLESHVVYSLSQANTATLFYIVQSTWSIGKDDLVPIQDAICSLQGPVVKESLGSWVITPVVEYYHLLPYAEIISKFFSRASNTSSHHVEKISADANIFQASQKPCEKADCENKVSDDLQLKAKLDSESGHISSSSSEEPCDSKFTKNLLKFSNSSDGFISSWFMGGPFDQEVNEAKILNDNNIVDASSDSAKQDVDGPCRVESNNSLSGTNSKSIDKENMKDLKKVSTISQSKDEWVDGGHKSCMVSPNVVRTPTVYHALEDFHSAAYARTSELSEAALRALLNKRKKLYHQQEVINGELTLCDNKIQAIMHGDIGDCLGLKLEAIIDCCNEICKQDGIRTQEHTNLHVTRSLPLMAGKSLSEAQLTLRKACQARGFVANVTVKGTNFDCSGVSGIQPSIPEARDSAATHAITRLQQMANQMNTG
ncbi:hypothetical protein R6Q59_015250 [Mikania micrantha]